MTRELVFIHGRSQQNKDADALKKEWLDALGEGLAKSGLTLPIPETQVRFPYYGNTLFDLSEGKTVAEAAKVIVRGDETDAAEKQFVLAMLDEIRRERGISDEQLAEVAGQDVVEKGPLNWPWVRAALQAIDRFLPESSSPTIALFTHDVYVYLTDSGIRQVIEDGICEAMKPGVETVVVSHSLGTVVAYNLFRREGHLRNWQVPLFVTVGSPLAITAIRKKLKSFAPTRIPQCADAWFNAMDPRDVVALYPLDAKNFPIDPAAPEIENKTDISNKTENRHSISGYLDDEVVAARIHEALTK
ncbi:hypothetical protein A5784_02750 [Mycobacterium sp. 852013-50091_SCH5140682]|uniref:hypothetical protein n=1 Tax=Mycobacterium sp. 852013-50091_SCH5140682 TaxID=1834109 RepID=UPI0007E9CD49|nr:hypothetical protein [Mycobacterium sp. 852013-50091_SCH5140682]OBC15356.1 hypothetical protein A5784_02750 [Mycobacterium sp. 852013-50091_SCH5140682]